MKDILGEFKIIRNALLRLTAEFFALITVFLFAPLIAGSTVAECAIAKVQEQFLPLGPSLAVFGPLDAFFAQASVAAALACAVLLPLFFFEVWRYVAPGLTFRERTIFGSGLIMGLFLTALGAAFAWALLVPVVFNELAIFLPEGVAPLFGLRKTMSLVAGPRLPSGRLFLLPLFMTLLSFSGLVPARAWSMWARPALVLILIASAIITPDGSGVGMVLLSLPISALYAVGWGASTALTRRTIS